MPEASANSAMEQGGTTGRIVNFVVTNMTRSPGCPRSDRGT